MIEYVYVDRPLAQAVVEETKTMTQMEPTTVRPALRRVSRAGVRTNGLIRVQVWQKIAQSQGTTALLTASALQPGSADGFAQFAILYDECRCLGVKIYVRVVGSTSVNDSYVVAFDPAISGNLSSVVSGLEHKYRIGPNAVPSEQAASPDDVAKPGGFYELSAKTVKSFESGTTNDKIGSNWYPTSVTSSIIGYLKPYVENATGGTMYLTAFIAYDMEFKYRG